jgi:hypothetical protein
MYQETVSIHVETAQETMNIKRRETNATYRVSPLGNYKMSLTRICDLQLGSKKDIDLINAHTHSLTNLLLQNSIK